MPAPPHATPSRIKDVNVRYHDVAASEYDAKWGIDFGPIGQTQVRAKLAKALGGWPPDDGNGVQPPRFSRALEIGAGTGYMTLNLLQLGLIGSATATDISPGMLEAMRSSADRLGLEVELAPAEAEELPFEDGAFDLVFGHAVLHHIPGLERAFAEFHRVLAPGGTLAFCGEPSRYGDALARVPKRGAQAFAPIWRRALRIPSRAAEASNGDGHELEPEVDVHAFAPGQLAGLAGGAGFEDVRVRGEELLSNMYGWVLRSLESSADEATIPDLWRHFAFRSYLALQRLDASLLEPRLPPALFYNLIISARKGARY